MARLGIDFDVNFTPRANQTLLLARKEADRLNHHFVCTEHLLLGLIKLGQGFAVTVLQRMGVNLQNFGTDVEKEIGFNPCLVTTGSLPLTPRTKKVLSWADKEAKALRHCYVGTEHLLIGLLREGHGVAARVLTKSGVSLDRTRQEVLKELDPNGPLDTTP